MILLFCRNAHGFNIKLNSTKTIENPTMLIQKPSSTTICGGEELKLKYTTTGNYLSNNIFTFSLVYTLYVNNTQEIKRYILGKSTLSSGEVTFKIPTDILSAYYQLEVSSSSPYSSKIYDDISFYVSQTPNVTISGNTIVNVGSATCLSIINASGGRYQCILSDSTQMETFLSRLYSYVNTSKTTTYKILSVFNECGIGKSSGSATVTVNPVSEKKIEIESYEFNPAFSERYPSICSGATYTIRYKATGNFSATNKFTVQISDENGENFRDVATEETTIPLKLRFTTPDDLKPSIDYRLRVVASDKDASSAANLFPLIRSGKGPTAMFEASNYFFMEGRPIDIKISLTGESPWRLRFGNEEKLAKEYENITTSPFNINITPTKAENYKIFELFESNCSCPGKVIGTNTVRLELITANEELSDMEVKLFPNPTFDKITIQSDNFNNTTLQVLDNVGQYILQQNIVNSETVLDISTFKTGQYLLQIQRDNKQNVYKIGKL